MLNASTIPAAGDIVRVRQRQYLVEEVVPGEIEGHATKVGLACVDDDAQGQRIEVLWERELDARNESEDAWSQIGRKAFDDPELFSAYFHTLKWNCVTATDARLFQSPFRAGIKVDAYQLEPLRKALMLPRVSLFIADDVGLGKTIESGLIARELLLRRKVRDIVVVCPPAMIPQWQAEMEQRFGLTFEVYDRAFVARMRQERGYAVNPWTTHTRFIISSRVIHDEAYAAPMRDWLGGMKSGSLLIFDEAHHAAPSSGSKYAIDTKITKAIRQLSECFEHRLFLSATPHNGHSNSFSALMEILDRNRFTRGVPIEKRNLNDVMVRRLKEDLRQQGEAFPFREAGQIDIKDLPEDAPELVLPALLDQYRMLREQRLSGEDKKVQAASGIVVIGLQKRLLSSIEAFAKTLKVHRQTVAKHEDAIRRGLVVPPSQLPSADLLLESPDADDDRAEWSEDEQSEEERVQMEAVTRMAGGQASDATALALFEQELALLARMAQIAEDARGKADAKIAYLLSWIEAHQCPDLRKGKAAWTDTRLLIFTEYEDTRRYLMQQLKAHLDGTDQGPERIQFLSGMTSADQREAIKRAFNQDPKTHPLRILVATDAAREGLNLQTHCRDLVHFDVPWNPGRMEQRNGRIDRKLQPAKTVSCRYFFYQQRPEDQVLQKLVEKTDTIRKELGSLGKVLENRLQGLLLKQGIRRDAIQTLKAQVEAEDLDAEKRALVEEELEESRERQAALAKQIDTLRKRVQDARDAIGLDEQHFRSALSCSLKLLGADPLHELPTEEKWQRPLQRFAFPRLDLREGAEANWGPTMDTLRAPKSREQKPWEWRSKAPIRPVIFEDPGIMDDRVVHLHLEHRMVQRLLGRFTAQGFYHDLSRACFAHSKDSQPRVVLLGRLSMYGPGAVRLHEELIPVAAKWVDPNLRKSVPLTPYKRDAEAESKTLNLLEDALADRHPRPVPEARLEMLQKQSAQDLQELLGPLKERAAEIAKDAEKQLLQRGKLEADSMREILTRQQGRIRETASQYGSGTLLGFDSTDEVRQIKADQEHWRKRLVEIDQELKTEPTRIQQHYDVKVWRVEPVGLAYLWPVTG